MEYLLKKVLSSMSLEVGLGELEELLAQEAQAAQSSGGLSVWQFLELFNSGCCLRGVGRDTLSIWTPLGTPPPQGPSDIQPGCS